MRKCGRCEAMHNTKHYWCLDCRSAYNKETPEERARWKSLKKVVSKEAEEKRQREKNKEYQRRYRATLPPSLWASKVSNWRRIGITNPPETREEYEELIAANEGICPACRRPPKGGKGNGWALHHNHKTGLVVGVVCSRCNMGMGQFEDNPDLLMTVAFWLVEQEEREGLYA